MKPLLLLSILYFSLTAMAIPNRGGVAEFAWSESSTIVDAIDHDEIAVVSRWLAGSGHSPLAIIKNKMKERLIDRAISHGSEGSFALLVKKINLKKEKHPFSDSRGTPLAIILTALAAPSREKTSRYEKMLETLLRIPGLNVNEKDRAYIGDGRTALHQAAANGNLKVMKLLVSKKANPNTKNSSGETPLHLAARYGSLEGVRYLLSVGAKVNEKTTYTQATPLMAAAETGHADVIRLLMRSGAQKEHKDTFGKTAPDRYQEFRSASNQKVGSSASEIATPSKKR